MISRICALIFVFPPVGKAKGFVQTKHFIFVVAFPKIICSFLQDIQRTFMNFDSDSRIFTPSPASLFLCLFFELLFFYILSRCILGLFFCWFLLLCVSILKLAVLNHTCRGFQILFHVHVYKHAEENPFFGFLFLCLLLLLFFALCAFYKIYNNVLLFLVFSYFFDSLCFY